MIAVKRLKYNGLYSDDLDLIVDVALDSDQGDTDTYLNREAVASESYNGTFRRTHNFKYSDVFAPTFTYMKYNFEEFSFEEQERVLSWLTSKSTSSFLSVYYDDSNVISWEALGGWTEIKTHKLANNRTIAITAVFESDNPWAFSPIQQVVKKISAPTTFTLKVNSDDAENPIYPRITIEQNNTVVVELNEAPNDNFKYIDNTVYHYGNTYYWKTSTDTTVQSSATKPDIELTSVVITNIHNGITSESVVKGNVASEVVTLDGANQVVKSNYPTGRIFGSNFNWTWLPLFDGENTISVVGNCTVTFEWREPIKIGEW